MKLDFDVLVIGAGPSGMTAAIYLKRANVSVGIIETNAPGGQLNRINNIDNYPGVLNSDGPTLAYNIFSQMQDLHVPYIYGKVIKINDDGVTKTVITEKEEIKCKSVIIASGRHPIETGLDIEKKLIGRGISYCAVCDGSLYKDRVIAVYTDNELGLEEAKYLSNIASKVYVIGLGNDNFDNIEFINSTIQQINDEDGKLKSIVCDGKTINIEGLFVILGSKPSSDYIEVSKINDYIVVDNNMNTSKEGIFACGDVVYKNLYQVSNAVGEGAVAAKSAISYIELVK